MWNRESTARAALSIRAAVWSAVVLSACQSPDRQAGSPQSQSSAPSSTAPGRAANATALADSRWRLVSFQSMDDTQGTTRPKDPTHYTMRLNRDGTVMMRLECNHALGKWFAEPGPDRTSGRFEFSTFAATRSLCRSPSMDETVAKQAQYIRSYLLKDGRLNLSLMADGGIFVWEPDTGADSATGVPPAPEGGGPRNWEVTAATKLREQPSASGKEIAAYTPGTILDNLGCRRVDSTIWCDVQKFGGGARGYVSLEYLKPAVSPDGAVATGPDNSALRAGQGKFDATGMVPCAQHVGQPMMQCEFGVARGGGGDATVVIKKPDGRSRALFFHRGVPINADTAESEGNLEFRASKESDLNLVRVGAERYEIPDAVVLGG